MQYRRLGGSGLQVSTFSIGSWLTFGGQVGLRQARACLDAALEAGVNFIDNAEVYSAGVAELVVGQLIQNYKREDLVISSKVFWGGDGPNQKGLSRKHVVEACHGALQRMNLEYLDLYFCHRYDPETPVYEVCETMDMLIRQGKVLYWGTSEWTAEQLQEAYRICKERNLIKPTMEQPEYNMYRRERVERELAPLCREEGLGTTIWSPLAGGLLTGKYNHGIPENSRITKGNYPWMLNKINDEKVMNQVRSICALAEERGWKPAHLALAWCAKSPYVSTVITGATTVEQVRENMKSIDVLEKLDEETMAQIQAILES